MTPSYALRQTAALKEPLVESMSTCPNCEQSVPPGLFCASCGKLLPPEQASYEGADAQPAPTTVDAPAETSHGPCGASSGSDTTGIPPTGHPQEGASPVVPVPLPAGTPTGQPSGSTQGRKVRMVAAAIVVALIAAIGTTLYVKHRLDAPSAATKLAAYMSASGLNWPVTGNVQGANSWIFSRGIPAGTTPDDVTETVEAVNPDGDGRVTMQQFVSHDKAAGVATAMGWTSCGQFILDDVTGLKKYPKTSPTVLAKTFPECWAEPETLAAGPSSAPPPHSNTPPAVVTDSPSTTTQNSPIGTPETTAPLPAETQPPATPDAPTAPSGKLRPGVWTTVDLPILDASRGVSGGEIEGLRVVGLRIRQNGADLPSLDLKVTNRGSVNVGVLLDVSFVDGDNRLKAGFGGALAERSAIKQGGTTTVVNLPYNVGTDFQASTPPDTFDLSELLMSGSTAP